MLFSWEQVALLFLITDKFPHEATWRAFFEAAAPLPAPSNLHLLAPAALDTLQGASAAGGGGAAAAATAETETSSEKEAAPAGVVASAAAGGLEAVLKGVNGEAYVHPSYAATYRKALGNGTLYPALEPWEEEKYPYWIARHNAIVAKAKEQAEKEAKEQAEKEAKEQAEMDAKQKQEGGKAADDPKTATATSLGMSFSSSGNPGNVDEIGVVDSVAVPLPANPPFSNMEVNYNDVVLQGAPEGGVKRKPAARALLRAYPRAGAVSDEGKNTQAGQTTAGAGATTRRAAIAAAAGVGEFEGVRISTSGAAAAGWDAQQSGVPTWEAALIKAEQGRLLAEGLGQRDPYAMLRQNQPDIPLEVEISSNVHGAAAAASDTDQASSSSKNGTKPLLRPVPEHPAYAAQDLFNVYLHTDINHTISKHSIFAGRQLLELQDTTYGYAQHALVDAMVLLLKAALAEPENVKFVLVSDTSVPLYPPEVVYAQLLVEEKSRVDACAKDGWMDEYR